MLHEIASDLLEVNEITDFRSNRNRPVKNVVNIGSGLYRVLKNSQASVDRISINIKKGDIFTADDRVTHTIIYLTDNSRLGVRMRYDEDIDKFHIVGYSGKLD